MNNPEAAADDGKELIAKSFGGSADYYDQNAMLQKEVAGRLIASLEPWKDTLPPGPILETGCGTGFVTGGLVELFPDRELVITDISPEMVAFCRHKIGEGPGRTFRTLDVEELDAGEKVYAMTVHGFVSQWFKDPALTLGRCLEATKPGGLLLASFPGNESFPEWKKCCEELGIPFTGNKLPDTEEMVIKLSGGPVQVDFYEDTLKSTFESASAFFAHLKNLGAGAQQEGRSLSGKEMRMLINHWDNKTKGEIEVSYHVVYLAVKRNFDS